MLMKLLTLMVAGGLGTLARYGLSGLVHRLDGSSFPWGTVVVNLLGCFAIGILWGMIDLKGLFGSSTRVLILIGFMGAFTTFSSYVLETGQLVQAGQWFPAVGNLLLQNLGGFALFVLGLLAVRIF